MKKRTLKFKAFVDNKVIGIFTITTEIGREYDCKVEIMPSIPEGELGEHDKKMLEIMRKRYVENKFFEDLLREEMDSISYSVHVDVLNDIKDKIKVIEKKMPIFYNMEILVDESISTATGVYPDGVAF